MVNILDLKQKIIDNADEYIPLILENLNCKKIKKIKNEYRATSPDGSNSTSVVVKINNLFSECYTPELSVKGDLFILIQKFNNCNFNESINFIQKILRIETVKLKPKIEVFDGYYKKFRRYYSDEKVLQIYSESELKKYLFMPHRRFLKDGISIETQLKYEIGYNLEQNRIIVPWRHMFTGELIGIMGRYNDDIIPDGENKWFPLIAFSKSLALFGYYQNYNNMINSTVIIVESEKGVMQLDSMDIPNGVAVGGHTISTEHKRLIDILYPKNVIVAFDSDIPEEILKKEAKKLISNNQFNNANISYIFDRQEKIMKPEMKISPTDLDKDILRELLQNYRYLIK